MTLRSNTIMFNILDPSGKYAPRCPNNCTDPGCNTIGTSDSTRLDSIDPQEMNAENESGSLPSNRSQAVFDSKDSQKPLKNTDLLPSEKNRPLAPPTNPDMGSSYPDLQDILSLHSQSSQKNAKPSVSIKQSSPNTKSRSARYGRPHSLPIWLSVSTYILSVVLLLQFLSCIHLPVWASVLLVTSWALVYAGHTVLRDFSSAWSPVYVQSATRDYARIEKELKPLKEWNITNCLYQAFCLLHKLYFWFRHTVVSASAVMDQLSQLLFLTLHGAFEGAVPANGALLGLQNPFFALVSCLIAGGVEIAGEHNALFSPDEPCCSPPGRLGFTFRDCLVLLPIFLGNLLFSAVVFMECIPVMIAYIPILPGLLSSAWLSYALTAALSLSYATVFTLILSTLPAKVANFSFTPTNTILCALAVLSAGIWFFEFYAHIALFSPLPVAFVLASSTALSRATLFFFSITVTHMCGGGLDLGEYNWMKSLAAWAGGIIAGVEFFEFLGSFSVPISTPVMFILMGIAIFSAVVVEGAFFGPDSKAGVGDCRSHPVGAFFTAVSSTLLPRRVSLPSLLLSGLAAATVFIQGSSLAFGFAVCVCVHGFTQSLLSYMKKAYSRSYNLAVPTKPGGVDDASLSRLTPSKRLTYDADQSLHLNKLSFLSYLQHLSGATFQTVLAK